VTKDGKMGRKPAYPETDDKILGRIEAYAQTGCTLEMIAAEFDISLKSLNNWRKSDPRIEEAYKKGYQRGNLRILDTAFSMARSGKQPAMTMFLMKVRLRMSERERIDLSAERVKQIVDLIVSNVKDADELKRLEDGLEKIFGVIEGTSDESDDASSGNQDAD